MEGSTNTEVQTRALEAMIALGDGVQLLHLIRLLRGDALSPRPTFVDLHADGIRIAL